MSLSYCVGNCDGTLVAINRGIQVLNVISLYRNTLKVDLATMELPHTKNITTIHFLSIGPTEELTTLIVLSSGQITTPTTIDLYLYKFETSQGSETSFCAIGTYDTS
jgi:hypothetical protein